MKYQIGNLVASNDDKYGYIVDVLEHQKMIHIIWFENPNKVRRTSFSYFDVVYRIVGNV